MRFEQQKKILIRKFILIVAFLAYSSWLFMGSLAVQLKSYICEFKDIAMEIEYNHGYRTTSLVHEMSSLEAAIAKFERKANSYYKKKLKIFGETEENRLIREQELASALLHLKHERKRIAILSQIQNRLQEYQLWGKGQSEVDPLALLEESHHPVRILARNMRAGGHPQPSVRHTPHHIIMGKGRHPQTIDSRLNLHLYGIRINDPDNGVWMPRTKKDKGHWSMPNAPSHSEIHTFNYETWVNSRISHLEGEIVIRGELLRIRSVLRGGKQPKKVTDKKDAQWSPKS